MLIQCTIFLFGVNLGISIAIDPELSLTEATNSSLLNFESVRFKPKRETDAFNFDISSFDDFSSSTGEEKDDKNEDDKAVFFDGEDVGSIISSPSLNIARSSAQNFGTEEENSKPLKFLPSIKQSSHTQTTSRPSSDYESQSYENQSAPDQVRQTNIASNQVTTPYIGSFVTYQAQPNTYQNDNPYKPASKVPFNANLPSTNYASTIPVYAPLTQAPLRNLASSHQHLALQSASQSSPKTRYLQDFNLTPTKTYAPTHYHNQQQQHYGAPFLNYRHKPHNRVELPKTTTVDVNVKRTSLPILHVQSTPNFSRHLQPLGTTPVIYSTETGLPYKIQPNYGGNFDYAKFKSTNQRSGTNTPFLSTSRPGSTQILPLHAASSTAQFPRYNGASIAQSPSRGFSKVPDEYQDFQSQTQLHFDGNKNIKLKNYPVSAARSRPFEQIRTDVEVIDKKKPIPPLPKEDDDGDKDNDDSGEGYDNDDTYSPKSEEDDQPESPPKNREDDEPEEGFKPSKPFSFKGYDRNFGENKKDSAENEDDNVSINLAAKYRYFDKSGEENNDESTEDGTHSKFKAYPLHDHFDNHSNEGDDDGEETQKQEDKQETTKYSIHGIRKPRDRQVGNYEKEFEESFKKKQKKPTSLHYRIKESDESNGSDHPNGNYHRNKSPTKSSEKYTDREETGAHLNPTATLSTQNYAGHKAGKYNSKLKKDNTKSKSDWGGSFGPKASNLYDDDDESTNFSQEEASEPSVSKTTNYGVTKKLTIATPQQYVTSQLYPTKSPLRTTLTSTALPKITVAPQNVANIGFTTFISHGDNNQKEKKFNPITSSSYTPLNTGPKSLINTRQNYQNPLLGRGEIYRTLKGI